MINCVSLSLSIYIYVYRERERDMYVCMYVYIYIYIYVLFIGNEPAEIPPGKAADTRDPVCYLIYKV